MKLHAAAPNSKVHIKRDEQTTNKKRVAHNV